MNYQPPNEQPDPNTGIFVSNKTKPSNSPKLAISLGILIILIVGGIIFFRSNKAASIINKATPTPSPTPAEGQVTHYIGSQTIDLKDVRGENSSGSAKRTYTATLSTHSVNASLSDPPAGSVYIVWIIKDNGNYIDLGKLEKQIDGKYTLLSSYLLPDTENSFSFDELYNTIVVSLETNEDNTIETKVLEGKFTQ